MKYDSVVKGGTLVIPFQGFVPADIGIHDGKIAGIVEDIPLSRADAAIDARGLYVFPGVVDPHTHMGNNLPFIDDFRTETLSAAAGGVTTFLALVKLDQFSPGGSYVDVIPGILKDLAPVLSIDVSLHCQIPGMRQALEAAETHAKLGLQSFKFYTVYKDRQIAPGIDDGIVFALLRAIATSATGALPMVHAEAEEILNVLSAEVRRACHQGIAAWDEARPPLVEAHALLRILDLAERLRCPLYVVHVTSADALEVLRAYQAKGLPIIGETCTHYLSLTTDAPGTAAKVNPPIRSRPHVEALWDGIRTGALTCLGTDHSAKLSSMKGDDVWTAVAAFPGLETSLAVVLTEAKRRDVPLVRIAEIAAANPARAFGLAPRKGQMVIGGDADFAIVDLNADRTIRAADLHSAADFTPYEGMRVTAWPLTTVLRGRVVFDRGKFLAHGQGKFLPRFPATAQTQAHANSKSEAPANPAARRAASMLHG